MNLERRLCGVVKRLQPYEPKIYFYSEIMQWKKNKVCNKL